MLDKKEKQELNEKLVNLRKDISSLRTKLNELNKQKEDWYSKKENLKDEIKRLVKGVKDIKNISDSTRKNITQHKGGRDNYNKKVKELIEEIKKLNQEKKDVFKKLKIKDPIRIKKDIDKLEESIEVEAFSFDKETKIMKKIKDLKKVYQESSQATELLDKIDHISKEIEETRNKAQDYHNKFIDSIKGNKGSFNSFMELSKKIFNLNKEQETAFEKFINFKKEFAKVGNLLKEKLLESKVIKDKLINEEQEKNRMLKEKQKNIVEEKLKAKKKLTTEDLLAFREE
jgi:uncharacterized coiled-coil DUF342 family protein